MADEPLQEGADTGSQDRPDFLMDKFSTVEAQARSAAESERKMHEATAELAELRSEFDQIGELIAQQNVAPQQQQPAMDQNPLVLAAQQAWENGDVAQFMAIQAQVSQAITAEALAAQQQQNAAQNQPTTTDPTTALLLRAAEAGMRERFPDYDQFREQVGQTLDAVPGLVPELTLPSVEQGVERAYKLAKADALMQNEQNSAAQQAAAEAERQQKLAATGLMGGGARTAAPDEAHQHMQDLINMRSGTFSELLNDARK